jgi:hypothetical protein
MKSMNSVYTIFLHRLLLQSVLFVIPYTVPVIFLAPLLQINKWSNWRPESWVHFLTNWGIWTSQCLHGSPCLDLRSASVLVQTTLSHGLQVPTCMTSWDCLMSPRRTPHNALTIHKSFYNPITKNVCLIIFFAF